MAGYAYGLDDGGAIPDDEDEAPQPPISTDNTNDEPPAQAVAPAIPEPNVPTYGPMASAGQDLQNNNPVAKRIMQYLLGADAAHPDAAAKMVQATKLEHPELSDDDAQLVAVHKAMEQGGPEAAHQLLQYNRGAYNYKAAVAASLLNGSAQGKPPDLQGAADAATEASKHILDGSNARFVASPGGTITATVKPPGADNPSSYNLTPQQFGELFNIGGAGQFDRLLGTGGLPAALARLSANTGSSAAQPPTGQQSEASATQNKEDRGTQPAPSGGAGKEEVEPPGEGGDTLERTGLGYDKSKGPQYDEDLQARANQMFPWISQAQQKARWLAQTQEQRDTAEAQQQSAQKVATINANSRIQIGSGHDVARVQSAQAAADARKAWGEDIKTGRIESARLRAQEYAQTKQQQMQIALANLQQRANNQRVQNQLRALQIKTNDPNLFARKSPDEVDQTIRQMGLGDLLGGDVGAPAAQPQAPQTPQAAAPRAPQQVQSQAAMGSLPAPPAAIAALRQHPEMADQFDAKYGQGASAKALGR